MGHAGIGHSTELLLHQHRIGSGHAGRHQMGNAPHTQRTDDSARLCQHGRGQSLRQPPSGRRFTVGARDRQHLQSLAGLLIVSVSHPTCLGFELGHAGEFVGADFVLQRGQPRRIALFFHQAGTGPLRQSLRQKSTPIGRCAGPSDESITLLDLAAVSTKCTGHTGAQPRGGL